MRSGVALPPIKRARPLTRLRIVEIKNYAKRNSTVFITRDYTTIKLIRLTGIKTISQHKLKQNTAKTALLLVCSSIATTPCRSAAYICSDLQTHIIRQARIEVTAAYALNYLELQFLSANIIALVGTVLYNAIKEYYDDRMRKTIYFHSYTVEDNYNAICKKSNVTVLDDYHDNDVNNILIKYEYRTSHSNKEDIEANEREEETKVRLRELSGEIHDILLREFREANNFTESVIHNDDEQELEPEDCDALVERYEEEINCSDLYSTM
ncbi:hypothetical protein HBI39_204730 [Parastagonospora nodorum]|nr:hypothetical protein HBI39_204730 [Parastagonospora nodorum]